MDTATVLLDDRLKLQQVLPARSLFGASLNEVTGRHQCTWMECIKVPEEGTKRFAPYAFYHITRYRLVKCQMKVLRTGFTSEAARCGGCVSDKAMEREKRALDRV